MDVAHQVGNLGFWVKNFHTCRVGIVADAERAGDGVGVGDHLLDGVVEAVCHEVDRLVLGDRVLLLASRWRVELAVFGFVGQAVLEFAKRREQTGTEGFQLTILATQTELDREPEAL